ncbi:MAG: helix-turn-helix domain-containing protein [Deltaproteobacteria bacterium]|nr:helix-turn-helix domain-containing protein [Deltaproteobacteria bacterium]
MSDKSAKKNKDRPEVIIYWLEKIEKLDLSISDFFKKFNVPFSRSQYYIYRKKLNKFGESDLQDKRIEGGNKRTNFESEAFIAGCIAANPNVSLQWLSQKLAENYGYKFSPSGITRVIQRLHPAMEHRSRGRPKTNKEKEFHNSCGGFELIIALAYHLEWPQMAANTIKNSILSLKRTKAFKLSTSHSDSKDRDKHGRFTTEYNQRADIRKKRFESITEKRDEKNWNSMNIIRDNIKTIERKSLAILSLPIITMNGSMRTVDSALGQELRHFAGFDYKQNSLTKYLSELKYLGVSSKLLEDTVAFWSKCWGTEMENLGKPSTLLCYYIDGNTKAVWSSKRVKKNKVTMLGRVMGCLEQVFIHDALGHPIYFETYSGHGPCGEHILGMFKKIEATIEDVPGARTSITRVLVMDGASNSVGTLRAFASQRKYHYITPLDDNQWKERKIVDIGRPTRYSYGKASLRDAVIELEDSKEKGFFIRTRAIKIDWDNGNMTVLLTSLPIGTIGSSEIVQSYFNRWPAEELQFRHMKSAVSLHRVAGYGKQEIQDEHIAERQSHTAKMINKYKELLNEAIEDIGVYEEAIAKLIPKERRLRNQGKIQNGKLKLPKVQMEQLNSYEKEVQNCEKEIKKIEKEHCNHFRLLRKHRREWLRLQGKETVYKMDVELDQILTFHRVSLANLYAYFIKHFLGGESISLIKLLHKIIHIPAIIRESEDVRKVVLNYNKKDKFMMEKLSKAIEKINTLNVIGPQGKRMEFSFENQMS